MEQLTLEQLEVESYAVQPSEQELTDLKGGTGPVCIGLYAAGATIITAGIAAWATYSTRTPVPKTQTTETFHLRDSTGFVYKDSVSVTNEYYNYN